MDIDSLTEKFQLTKQEKSILTYIHTHKTNRNMGIKEVAKATYCAPSSIVSMCKKMKFSGYSELLYYMNGAKNLTFTLKSNDYVSEYGDIFYQLIQKHRHSQFMVIGFGFSNHIASYISDYLNLHGFRATNNSYLQLLRPINQESTVLIVISNSGETKRLIELLDDAKENNVTTVSLVGNSDSTLAMKADATFSTNTNSAYSYQDYYPQLFFGKILIIFETLMSYILSNMK